MAVTLKAKGATLSSTLTTTLHTASGSTRMEHIIISNGSTAGTITLSFYDGTTAFELLNAVAIAANETIELANIILENADEIRGGATTTTGAKIYMAYAEIT